jgi:hypothetical protein
LKGETPEKIIEISTAILSDTETKSVYRLGNAELSVKSIFDTHTPYSKLLYSIVKTKMRDYSKREAGGASQH